MDLVKLEPTIDNLRQGVSRISQLLAGQWDPKRDALLRTAEQVNQILMEKEGRDEGETLSCNYLWIFYVEIECSPPCITAVPTHYINSLLEKSILIILRMVLSKPLAFTSLFHETDSHCKIHIYALFDMEIQKILFVICH